MLKAYILLVFCLFTAVASKAQFEYNYTQYAVGTGASYVHGYTNLNIQKSHFAESFNFTYYLTAYIPLTAEVQSGTLSGGSLTLDPDGRVYTTNYLAIIFYGDFQLGQVVNQDNFFKDFYGGTGFGLVSVNAKVQRTSIHEPTYVFPGVDKSLNPMLPLRIGYEYKFLNSYDEPFLRINFGYEHNFVFGQGLDGYNDPPTHFKHNAISQYGQIYIGVKFDFGSREQ